VSLAQEFQEGLRKATETDTAILEYLVRGDEGLGEVIGDDTVMLDMVVKVTAFLAQFCARLAQEVDRLEAR
jgi:hypothetical protein